ncbi:MAG TPA: pyridoxal-phosphate dependent enzyme [Ignavibacteriaceae bacterium]|nr:pyridoxal-phosphate dependent enzyme [Ignavibacteriaceae bacterium]
MNFKENILEAVGNTPLVKLNKLNKGLKPQIFAKLESSNPGGSVKDRIGLAMLESAEKNGDIKPAGTIIEATSGNTGIGLALAAAVKGYKSIFVVTDKVSSEKINYLKALGGDVIVVSNAVGHDHPDYYITVAKKIEKETPNSIFMYQYSNPANPEIHYKTTGPEIWHDTEGKITHFVSGIGTGGTISGTGRFLKEQNKNIQVIGADPFGSIFQHYKQTGETIEGVPYLVEGIGQDCLPNNVHFQYIDRIINVSDQESFSFARKLSKEEGIFCGGSTGTNVWATLQLAKELDESAVIVFIVADTGERYLTKMHSEEWLRDKRMLIQEFKSLHDISLAKRDGKPKELISVKSTDKIKTAVELLNFRGFSQLPVIDDGESVGSLREAKLMSSLVENPSMLDQHVSKIMGPGLPTLDERTDLATVKKYLSDSPAVLVTEYGRIKDIITRYDIIEHSDLN